MRICGITVNYCISIHYDTPCSGLFCSFSLSLLWFVVCFKKISKLINAFHSCSPVCQEQAISFFSRTKCDLKLSYQHQLILKHINHMQMRLCHGSEVVQHQAVNENKKAEWVPADFSKLQYGKHKLINNNSLWNHCAEEELTGHHRNGGWCRKVSMTNVP